MKILLVFIIGFSLVLTGCANKNVNTENNKDYSAERLSISDGGPSPTTQSTPTPIPEEPLASFSTNILVKEPDWQNNITIACNALNGFIVKSGETFSFCNTLGPARPEDGYEKANSFDANGNTIQAYGGGKCQISTTLYNAVLQAPNLTVVERHEHSASVYYVPDGMDACVAYGSCDFQFRNDNNFDIKMYVSNTPDTIDVSLVKISS